MSPKDRIRDWFDEGNSGTTGDITRALDLDRRTVYSCIQRMAERGDIAIVDHGNGKGGATNVYARTKPMPRTMVQKALSSRTALEVAWA